MRRLDRETNKGCLPIGPDGLSVNACVLAGICNKTAGRVWG
jgi:hypothetical protein